jgi:DNA-binding response OmpR family regulator
VVEDDALVGETIAAMLDGHYEAIVAETVDQALSHLTALPPEDVPGSRPHPAPDLVLLDCLLPGGGLPALLQAADERAIPVVLISGDPARAAGIDASRPFLPKPFNQAKLLGLLRTIPA